MDIITPGIPEVCRGTHLFLDATCVSPLHANGTPMPQAAGTPGIVLQRADRKNKESDYPDVEASLHASFLSLSVETFGRRGEQSLMLVNQLARYKAASAPPQLRSVTHTAYASRWWALLSVAVQKAVAQTLVRQGGPDLLSEPSALEPPTLVDVLDHQRP